MDRLSEDPPDAEAMAALAAFRASASDELPGLRAAAAEAAAVGAVLEGGRAAVDEAAADAHWRLRRWPAALEVRRGVAERRGARLQASLAARASVTVPRPILQRRESPYRITALLHATFPLVLLPPSSHLHPPSLSPSSRSLDRPARMNRLTTPVGARGGWGAAGGPPRALPAAAGGRPTGAGPGRPVPAVRRLRPRLGRAATRGKGRAGRGARGDGEGGGGAAGGVGAARGDAAGEVRRAGLGWVWAGLSWAAGAHAEASAKRVE